ncbi:PREDICTED: F-box/kelch-repeat protein At3g23880-like [Erythranthe guttata]|uniref:F-box/kelch-repeat protein At3g23880-like n=1 Tax=Erythranthe guttata TaxID=4155 RepID=UPI00064D8615|nr:PREDICTED: F-box/kelch-repeat protein At3g23880-like [Erythranthe guttata]|eukprot:XP_012842264.1 PREDICTED: F-box/kelch-repeat protein At3g23880-like [Erythranthe guttata]
MAGKRRITNSNLPEEIIEEILYNLPIQSLLRFKCVSKSWLSTISSKAFIKEHLKRSIAEDDKAGLTDLTHHKLLFTRKILSRVLGTRKILGPNRTGFSYSLGTSSLGNESNIVTPTFYDYPMPRLCFLILGSCNGLVLMRYSMRTEPLILCNPSTRIPRVIPSPPFDSPVPRERHLIRLIDCNDNLKYGLGYDESNDDYKVVCIRDTNVREPHHYETRMYSSKADSWKKIESYDKRFHSILCGKFVNGRLHWLARFDSDDSHRGTIISLDLADEKYRTLSSNSIANFQTGTVVEFGGYLGLLSVRRDRHLDLWVMKEYGVTESWTKIWTKSDFVDRPDLSGGPTIPVCWTKNGDIVMVRGYDVLVCNGRNILRKSRVDMIGDRIDSIVYVESLVSPFIHQE